MSEKSANRITCRYDFEGEITSYNSLEIPIHGPAPANVLVSITGVAEVDLDTDHDLGTRDIRHLDVFIFTKYEVPLKDWVDEATTASLSSIQADDIADGDGTTNFIFAIDDVKTEQDAGGFIIVHLTIAVGGDVAIYGISFQSNILISRKQ